MTRADHHYKFLTNCHSSGTLPKGLQVQKTINLMEGRDKIDALVTIEEACQKFTNFMTDTLITYYEDLCSSEQEILSQVIENLRLLVHSWPDITDEVMAARESITKQQDCLSEQLTQKREHKLTSLKKPSPHDNTT